MTVRFLLFLFITMPLLLRAQRPFIQDIWMNENHLPLRSNVVLKDNTGYLLIGTDQGLYRYNGSSFKTIKSSVKVPVTALVSLQDQVWVGYRNGQLGRLSDDSIVLFKHSGYKPSAAIHAIYKQKDGTLWLGTEEGIVLLKEKSVKHYTTANGLADNFIYTLVFIDDNHLLAGTDQGIHDIRIASNGQLGITGFSADNGLIDDIARVVKPVGPSGQYWIGAQANGISVYDSRTHTCKALKIAGGWQWGQVNDILPVSARKAWVATDDGHLLEMKIITPDSVQVNAFACLDKRINAMLLDKAGNIWCVTSKGISLVTAEFLDYITLFQPYALSAVTAMCCDKNNVLWMALKNDVYCLDLNDEIKMLRKVFHINAPISALYCSADDNSLWMGTSGDGLWCKLPGNESFKKVNAPELAQESILSITFSKSNLWVSGLNGVKEYIRSGNSIKLFKTYNKASGIGSDYIYQLFTDSKERVWMATDGAGVCLYDGVQYYHWNTFKNPDNTVVYTLTEDAAGGIWAGTLYKDLFRFYRGRWENVRQNETLDIDVNLSSVNANATGQVVAVYQRCIDLWYPSSRYFRHFNNRHGLGMDSTSRVLNCSAKDTAGNVYVPFEKGLLIFKNQPDVYNIKPEVNIVSISSNLKEAKGIHEFDANENAFSFYFDGISFTNPERLNYRFRLEGYSDNWVYTTEPLATFPKLPSGDFTFRVQVSLNGSFQNAGEAVYTFKIAAPLWRRPWFIMLAVLAIVVVAYILIKYRDRRMQRLAQLEQERVLFDYEHLKSQVNPHFLFNSLNTLTNLIEENPTNAVVYTERLSDLYRNMLAYHDKELISLSEEWKILSAYLYIQQSRFGNALQINGNIPQKIKESKKIPPMALQLLVENAIKHNIVSLSSPLIINISANDQEIIVSNKITPKIINEVESGIGLNNISSRYALLTKRKVYFGREGADWVVRLPLL